MDKLPRDNDLVRSDKRVIQQASASLDVLNAGKLFVKEYRMMSRTKDQPSRMICFKPMLDCVMSYIKSTGRHSAMSLKRVHFQAQLFHGVNACDSSGLRPQIVFYLWAEGRGRRAHQLGPRGWRVAHAISSIAR